MKLITLRYATDSVVVALLVALIGIAASIALLAFLLMLLIGSLAGSLFGAGVSFWTAVKLVLLLAVVGTALGIGD